jgi:hypothetical protein
MASNPRGYYIDHQNKTRFVYKFKRGSKFLSKKLVSLLRLGVVVDLPGGIPQFFDETLYVLDDVTRRFHLRSRYYNNKGGLAWHIRKARAKILGGTSSELFDETSHILDEVTNWVYLLSRYFTKKRALAWHFKKAREK